MAQAGGGAARQGQSMQGKQDPQSGAAGRRARRRELEAKLAGDLVEAGPGADRERFIPVTRFALMERLSRPQAWQPGEAPAARRLFRYLDYWRHQRHNANLLELEQDYEPFSPDSDLLMTRQFTDGERSAMRRRVVNGIASLLEQANYVRIDPKRMELIMTKESHYGLDLTVDLEAFDELMIYFRGAASRTEERRSFRKFFRKEEYEVPVFQRLFILFKLKPAEERVRELIAGGMTAKDAERTVQQRRALLPKQVRDENIYMKMFKNMPRTDLEMIFPNTRVKFRMLDKIKLGVTSSAGLGLGVFSAAGKVALAASNPITAAGAVAGLGGIAFRQGMNFLNQRQRYMVVMARNLYFHAMADNRGVMIKLADRAAEEDIKEELLLYSVLAKEAVHRSELIDVDRGIERYLLNEFGVTVDFDLNDALGRLMADGLVSEDADGRLRALPPEAAAHHLDSKWDLILDHLPDLRHEGVEIDADPAAVSTRPVPVNGSGATA
jgi:hypothetical protein